MLDTLKGKDMKKDSYSGTIYEVKGRWYWKVKLPGHSKRQTIALKKPSGDYAVKSKAVAVELAKKLWNKESKRALDPAAIQTVGGLVEYYTANLDKLYTSTSAMPKLIRKTMELLMDCKDLPVDEFGPLRLREVQQSLIAKSKLSARTINLYIGQIKAMFDWAVGYEMVNPSAAYALKQVKNLSKVNPIEGVKASNRRSTVEIERISKVMPYLTSTLQLMVKTQLMCGMRPNEVCIMRKCDIDTSGEVWIYRPAKHKGQWRGHQRAVAIAKSIQEAIAGKLEAAGDEEYIFKPADGVSERQYQRRAAAKAVRKRLVGNGRRYDGQCYTPGSYRRAIDRACKRAGVKVWTPYQLRHTAATILRAKLGDDGLSAVQALLGQKSFDVAEHYARVNKLLAAKAAKILEEINI